MNELIYLILLLFCPVDDGIYPHLADAHETWDECVNDIQSEVARFKLAYRDQPWNVLGVKCQPESGILEVDFDHPDCVWGIDASWPSG